MVVPLPAERLSLSRCLCCIMSLQGYTERSEPASNRNWRLLSRSMMKRQPEVVVQTCAAVEVRCVGFSCGGRSRTTLLCPSSVAAMVPAGGGCSIILGWWSVAQAAVPGAAARIPGVGAEVSPGSGVEVGQLGAECCHLAGEVLDVLQKCTDLGEWCNAH
jgi:hypothetical protein